MRGAFIVFEGGDGVGKSTQAALLVDWLAAAGRDVVRTFEPGDTPAGAIMRQLVLDPSTGDLAPWAEALLYAADKAQHLHEVVRPALARGAVVVCDRYVDSMLAYQGAGRTLPLEQVERVATWATDGLAPDLTVLLDLDPRAGVGTLAALDRVEAAGDDFHARVRAGFLELAARAPERYLVLPARQPVQEIAETVQKRVAEILSDPTLTM